MEKTSTAVTAALSDGMEVRIRGDYQGGPYIDVSATGTGAAAFDVINLWDYRKGAILDGFENISSDDKDERIEVIQRCLRSWALDHDTHDWKLYLESVGAL